MTYMTDFNESEAREAAEKWCGDNKLMFDVASGYFIAGYRAAWEKAQGEIKTIFSLDLARSAMHGNITRKTTQTT